MSSPDDEWLRVHRHLGSYRYELGVAAHDLYPRVERVAATPLLTAPGWLPQRPVPLDAMVLELDRSHGPSFGVPEPRHSESVARLAPPAVFENRPTYRLLDAVLDDDRPRMRFGTGHYFDAVDTGGAVAHEFAAQHLARTNEQSGRANMPFGRETGESLPLRAAIDSPVDLGRRPVNLAISAVTIRHDRVTGEAQFLAHRRDPAKVAHAGGLLQVVPVGVFQPVSADTMQHDFSLWRCLQREFAEELLGEDEASGVVDYEAREFSQAIRRSFVLGLGVDPLTLAADLLCAVVVDGEVFDRVFAGLVSENAEGELSSHPFTADVVDRFVHRERMQAAGAAVLALAWQHRERLLS